MSSLRRDLSQVRPHVHIELAETALAEALNEHPIPHANRHTALLLSIAHTNLAIAKTVVKKPEVTVVDDDG